MALRDLWEASGNGAGVTASPQCVNLPAGSMKKARHLAMSGFLFSWAEALSLNRSRDFGGPDSCHICAGLKSL